MKRYLLPVAILLVTTAAQAETEPTPQLPHLPLSSDYCAILRAFTGAPDPACPEPQPPGAPRSANGQDSANATPQNGYFIHFAFDSNTLSKDSRHHLDRLSRALRSDVMAGLCVKLVGHADASGPVAYNQALSERRAKAVQLYLAGVGAVGTARITVTGQGERAPLPGLPDTAPQNRRVEILAKARGEDGCT